MQEINGSQMTEVFGIEALITGFTAIFVMAVGNFVQYKMFKKQLAFQNKQQAANMAFERERQFKQDKAKLYADFLASITGMLSCYRPVATATVNGNSAESDAEFLKQEATKKRIEMIDRHNESADMIHLLAPDDVVSVMRSVMEMTNQLIHERISPEKFEDFVDEIMDYISMFLSAARKDLGVQINRAS